MYLILKYFLVKYFRATVSVSTLKQASGILSDYVTLVACPVPPMRAPLLSLTMLSLVSSSHLSF